MTWISPDCRDGNHRKCNGEAWDEDADDLTDCQCPGCLCQVSPVPVGRRTAVRTCWCGEPTCEREGDHGNRYIRRAAHTD